METRKRLGGVSIYKANFGRRKKKESVQVKRRSGKSKIIKMKCFYHFSKLLLIQIYNHMNTIDI